MRIEGVTIPDEKRVEYALTDVYGVGLSRARSVLDAAGVDRGIKPKELTPEQEHAIRTQLEQFTIEGELKREVSANIKRLKDIKSYRGSRHTKHLPAHGQRTKVNSRTARGNVRKTMGSGKTKLDKK